MGAVWSVMENQDNKKKKIRSERQIEGQGILSRERNPKTDEIKPRGGKVQPM